MVEFERVGFVTYGGAVLGPPSIASARPGPPPETYKATGDDGAMVVAYVYGRGTQSDPFGLIVRRFPAEEGEPPRFPTMEELIGAVDCALDGAAFTIPPFLAGGVYPEAQVWRDVPLQQVATHPGSPAHKRFHSGIIIPSGGADGRG